MKHFQFPVLVLYVSCGYPANTPTPQHEQVARNNDLDNMHLLEAADEWPFLREVVGKAGDGEAGGDGGKQEHLLCDALVGEPFYYRVSGTYMLPSMIALVLAGGVPAIPFCKPDDQICRHTVFW